MSHQQVWFSTEVGVGCVKSDPKSLLRYMMRSRKGQEGRHTIERVGTITTIGEGPDTAVDNSNIDNVVNNLDFDDFDMIAIHPDYPDQKV